MFNNKQGIWKKVNKRKQRLFTVYINLVLVVLLRDREKGKFEMFYSTQNRNLNFPATAAETFKGGDPRKVKPATAAETIK